MKLSTKLFAVVTLLALAVAMPCLADQSGIYPSNIAGRVIASSYGGWRVKSTNAVAAASNSMTLDNCYPLVGTNNRPIFPFATNVPVIVVDGSSTESVTPSAVTTPTAAAPGSVNALSCSFTATFANAHSAGVTIVSGDSGLWEAINDQASGPTPGGIVAITPDWGGTTSQLTSGTGGSFSVAVFDERAGLTQYSWNGSTYSVTQRAFLSASSGARLTPFVLEENLALSTGGTTTDTATNLLPANSIIMGVMGRVTTTIAGGTCSSWQMGDPTTAGRFTAANSTLTAGTVDFGKVNLTTGIASASTGIFQTNAAKIRVTCGTGAPGAGSVRITTMGYTYGGATQ